MNKKDYHRNYNQKRYHQLRDKYIEEMGNKCSHCESTENLEFDHTDPKTKSIDCGRLLNHSQAVIKEELNKCQLLCHDCHVKKTSANKEFGGGLNRIDLKDAKHGTSIMYHKFKCKCDECRKYKKLSRLPR